MSSPMRTVFLCLPLALVLGCEKITVLECDDASHADAEPDGGLLDKDASPVDTGEVGDAGGELDGGSDAGNPGCSGGGYCIEALVPSVEVANVREMVVLTPTVRDDGQVLAFSGATAEITAARRPGLPDARLSDLSLTYSVDPVTGVAQFLVSEVPTWFSTTTFTVRVHATATGGPDVSAEASVTVRGNIALSGYSDVYTVASDGLPAKSVNFTQGRLLSGSSFVDSPEDLWMARDGTLLVYDDGASPPRIRRFALDGENSQLPDFQFEDGATPIIDSSQTGTGLTQLSDGRVVLIDYYYARSQETVVHVWNEDGTFSHSFNAPNPNAAWSGAAADDMGHLFVLESMTNGRLIQIDPATGFEQRAVTTDISTGLNLLWRPDGAFYVGLSGSVIRVSPQGGKQMVSGLPTGSESYRHLAAFGSARVITTRSTSSESTNVVLIENTENVGFFRQAGVGGPVFTPYGIASFE